MSARQVVSNALVSTLGPASNIRYRTPDEMTADRLSGDVGAICFALLGAALIVVAMEPQAPHLGR